MGRVVDLPSGAKLDITLAPFGAAKVLYQAFIEELATVKLDMTAEIDGNFFKDLACVGFTSKKIEAAMVDCLKRALYNGLHIKDELFEPEEARQDYPVILFEVASENIRPFTKSLYAKWLEIQKMIAVKNPA